MLRETKLNINERGTLSVWLTLSAKSSLDFQEPGGKYLATNPLRAVAPTQPSALRACGGETTTSIAINPTTLGCIYQCWNISSHMLKFISSILSLGLFQVNVVLPQALAEHSLGADLAWGRPRGPGGHLEGERVESQGQALLPASWPQCQGTVGVMFSLLLSK